MATKTALILATLVHILLRVSIFIEQPTNNCSSAPTLASLIYLASTLMVIYDYNIYPKRYTNIPVPCQRFAEVVMILLLIEFSTVVVWCSLERTFQRLLKCILLEKSSNMYYDMGGDFLTGGILIFCSIFIFVNTALATDFYYSTKRKLLSSYRKMVEKVKRMWGNLPLCYEKKPVCCPPMDAEPKDDPCRYPMQTRRRTTANCSYRNH